MPKITKLCDGFEVLAPKILYENCLCITLMKLTAAHPQAEKTLIPSRENFNENLSEENLSHPLRFRM